MIVYIFGNPDLPEDALPLRLVPQLRQQFPDSTFEVKDPNEEWYVPERLVVIDTVKGIVGIQVFHGLETFTRAPRVSMHDFDALTQMRLLQKIGKLKEVTIIGVPPEIDEHSALTSIIEELLRLQ
jgi:hypothetical protein